VDVDAPQSQPSWPSPVLDPLPPPTAAPSAPPAPDLYIIGAPSLPPAVEFYDPEPMTTSVVTRSYEHATHRGPELVGTGATRVLAAAGWLGSAVGYTVGAVVLSKSYRHITSDNWRAALKEIHWLLPLMISSFGMAYLGWVVWVTLAWRPRRGCLLSRIL